MSIKSYERIEIWEEEIRRIGGDAAVAIIRYLRDGQEAMLSTIQKQNELLKQLEARMEAFLEAFPARDITGHRRYHEAIIEHLEWKKRFYRTLVEKLVTGGIWGLAVFVVTCVGLGIKKWLTGG
jgi:hypothetical protein